MIEHELESGALVVRNSVILLVGQLLTQAITLVLGITITRVLGAAEYGRYVAAFAFATVFISFTGLGLEKLLIREIARCPTEASDLMHNATLVRLAMSLIVYVIMIAGTYILRFDAYQRRIALLAGVVTELTSLADFVRVVFQAFERMEFDALSRVLERITAAILVMGTLWYWRSAVGVTTGLLLSNLVALGGTLWLASKFVHFRGRPQREGGLTLLKMTIPFAITSVIVGVITRLGPFFLSLMRPVVEVGWYGAAMNLVLPLTLLPQAFSSSLFPRLSKQYADDPGSAERASSLSIKWTLQVAFPIAGILIGLADVLVATLYGSNYSSSALLLRLLAGDLVLIFVNTVVSNILGALGRQDVVAAVVTMYLMLTIALCLGLIPTLGGAGAALAIICRDLFGSAVMLWALGRATGFSPLRTLAGTFVSGVMMLAILGICIFAHFPSGWLIALCVYAGMLFVTRSIGLTEWHLVGQVLQACSRAIMESVR